jgi:outer membrane receptor protein involved in Fe transport
VVTLGLALLLSVAGTGQASTRAVQLNIRAQPLADSLKTVAEAFVLQIAFFPEDVQNIGAPALIGAYTADQAFAQLLESTSLEYRFVDEDSVAIGQKKASNLAPVLPAARDPKKSTRNEANARAAQPNGDDRNQGQGESAAPAQLFTSEIVVTAQKREQYAQEVPISLFALGGRSLEGTGLQDVQGMSDRVAGLNIVSIQPGSSAFAARGVTTLGGGLETNAAVGYYVDEVPVSASGQGPDFALWDVERVEVLRGPQGTLFGEGSMAGTIRVITNKPDLSLFSGRVAGDLSSTTDGGGNGNLRALVNIPVVEDTFALRVLAGYIDNDGWIDVPDLGEEDANTREQLDVRVAARWVPTDALVIDASYMRQDLDLGTEFTAPSPYRLLPTEQIPAAGPVGYLGPTDTVNQNANLTIIYDLGFASLVSATSYFDYTSDWRIDLTPFVPLLFGTETGGTAKNDPHATSALWAEELRLASNGDKRLDWTTGVFYKSSDRLDERNFQFYLEHAFGIPGFDLTDFSSTRETSKSSSYSLFGEVDSAFTEAWSLQMGLRYYSDDRDLRFEQLTDSIIFGAVAGTTLQAKGDDTDLAPKVSLTWKPNDEVMLYAKAAKGFRSGGTNANSELSPLVPQDYDAEDLWAYELGAKMNLSTAVMANAGVYYNDWTNLQLPFITPDGLFPFTANAGAARAVGGELELFAGLAKGLNGSLNVAYTDATITEQVENAVGGIVAQEGNTIPLTSDWTFDVAFDYRTPLTATMDGVMRAAWAHRTPNYSDPENSEYKKNAVYDQVGLSVGVATTGWSLDAYVDNLLDDASSTFKYNRVVAVPLTWVSYVRPRTIGIRFNVNF